MKPNGAGAIVAAALTVVIVAWARIAHAAPPCPGMANYDCYRLSRGTEYFVAPQCRGQLSNAKDAVMVTFLGTTTLLFDDGTTQFLIDGFLTRGVQSAIMVKTDEHAVDQTLARAGVETGKLKAVFVSHSHYDHAMDVGYIVQKFKSAILYGSLSTHNIGLGAGIPPDRNELFHVGQKLCVGAPTQQCDDRHFIVTVLYSRHSPGTKFPGYIKKPLVQPAASGLYREGGSYDFLVRHGAHTILIRASANYLPWSNDREDSNADVIFLSTGRLGKQTEDFRRLYFRDTVARLCPRLVIPMHWDDFFAPLSSDLPFALPLVDNTPKAFDSLIWQIEELNQSTTCPAHIKFGILQGFESIALAGK